MKHLDADENAMQKWMWLNKYLFSTCLKNGGQNWPIKFPNNAKWLISRSFVLHYSRKALGLFYKISQITISKISQFPHPLYRTITKIFNKNTLISAFSPPYVTQMSHCNTRISPILANTFHIKNTLLNFNIHKVASKKL